MLTLPHADIGSNDVVIGCFRVLLAIFPILVCIGVGVGTEGKPHDSPRVRAPPQHAILKNVTANDVRL